ncbi:MAG: SpoIIE family protein phosphatase [Deltaproteobacteria bacterium]|nr:SpoIIE family protein phosphatase [Deltaproteobacteria bacterium]
MKLRWKYFLILLVASLIPMAIVTGISQKATKKLGKSLSTETYNTLAASVQREIVSATENYAMITLWTKTSLELALQVLIREAAISLTLPPPEPTRIYFAKDFETSNTAPEDIALSSIHRKVLKDGKTTPKLISYNHPNFLLAPGVDRKEVAEDITKFTRLIPSLKGITGGLESSVFWIYASLESGVHISYPGHGGYPVTYDPRTRPWYTLAKKNIGTSWGPPIVDTTTNQLTFTVSAPFFNADGSVAGVCAIDVLIPNVLLNSQISSQWSKSVQSFLLGFSDMSGKGKEQSWVLSRKEQTDLVNPPAAGPGKSVFFQAGPEDFEKLLQYIEKEKSGSVEMPYQGVDSFWAYATIFPGLNFVIIAPKSMVMGLPEEVGARFNSYTRDQMIISITAVIIGVLFIAGIALLLSQKSNNNVKTIVNGIKRLEKGDFTARLDLQFNDERDLIITTFNHIVPRLEEHLRMSRALGVAKEVQQSLLPKEDPSIQGFDIAGTSIYCDETGGDYYDFININEGRLAVVVGDVSGHGISSALLMATARALIMLRASMPGRAASIINDVNKHLSLDTYDTDNFMTFFYCELTPAVRDVCWIRAGHDPALTYDPGTDTFDVLKGDGMAVGVDYSFEYEEFQCTLTAGQVVLIGTDGIWEMHNETGEMYGKEKLKEIIRTNYSATAKEIITIIMDDLKKFRGSKQPEDDVTMVVIKVNPKVT